MSTLTLLTVLQMHSLNPINIPIALHVIIYKYHNTVNPFTVLNMVALHRPGNTYAISYTLLAFNFTVMHTMPSLYIYIYIIS